MLQRKDVHIPAETAWLALGLPPVAEKLWEKLKTLNRRLPLEDSSDFDDFWTELIVMTWSIIWEKLRVFRIFSFVVVVVINYFHYEFKLNVNWKDNENKNASGGTCEGGAKRPPRRSLHPLRFCFRLCLNFCLIMFFDNCSGKSGANIQETLLSF